MLLAVVVVGCSSDGDSHAAPAVTSVVTAVSGEPTAAAAAAAERLVVVPDGADDCGRVRADAGWPSTTVAPPEVSRCLVDALAQGRRAVMFFTGRTGVGDALVTEYVVDGDVVRVTTYVADARGEVASKTRECTPPARAWSLGIDGGVVDVGSNTAHCAR